MNRAQRFRVRVNGVEHEVDVVLGSDPSTTHVQVNGHACEVVEGPDGMLSVRETGALQRAVWLGPGNAPSSAHAAGEVFALEIQTAQQAALSEAMAESGHAGDGSATIKAPMPGRVVRVLVEAGDEVALDDPILIVEAMKMENEVRATAPGRIGTLAVSAGDTVEPGQTLCEIVPHADPS